MDCCVPGGQAMLSVALEGLLRPQSRGSRSMHVRRCGAPSSALAAVLLACAITVDPAQTTTQEHVHQMSHGVVLCDMATTLHVFKMTEHGGVLRVVAREAGADDQIAMIQQHLKLESEKLQKGDYAD